MSTRTLIGFDGERDTSPLPYAHQQPGFVELDSQDHVNHAQMRARQRSSWEQSSTTRQQNTHLQRPAISYRPRHRRDGLKHKFSECSSSMEPVPEEDPDSEFIDDSSDHSSIGIARSTSSEEYETDLTTPDLGDGNVSQVSSSSQPPLSLHHDPSRQIAMEVEHVKQLHLQDKAFFQKELRNLRMLLFDAESNLQHRTEELEFVLQEQDAERWDWEQKRAEWEREKEREKEQLRERNRELEARLEAKRKEMGKLLGILEGAHRELLVCSPDGADSVAEPDVSNNATMSRKLTLPTGLARYATIPSRVASLRNQVDDLQQRYQTAYIAWSGENKALRQKHQQQLKSASDDVKKGMEEVKRLGADNKALKKRASLLKASASQMRRESSSMGRISRDLPSSTPSDASSTIPVLQDKIPVEDALKHVHKLNGRIAEAAAILSRNLAITKATDSPSYQESPDSAATREASFLLGGDAVTSQLTFLPAPSKTKDNATLRTLLQIALTNWTASHVHCWDLDSSETSQGSTCHPLEAIYRKLKVSEEPPVVAAWRNLARSQIRFPSSSWSRSLISSIHSVLSFLGLTYTQPVSQMAKDLQPLLSSLRAVREALGELVVSKELEVVTVTPGTRFDFRRMKGVHLPGSQSSSHPIREPERVIATCGLGVKAVEGHGSERLLLLPQIICKQSLCDMLSSLV